MAAKNQPVNLVAYKETREGIYGPYEVEVDPDAKKEVRWHIVESYRVMSRYRACIMGLANAKGKSVLAKRT